MIANADTPDRIKNHKLLEGIDIPATGIPTRAGTLLTKTLLFVAEGNGTADARPLMRAVEKNTGEIVATIELPANQTGLPFTYEHCHLSFCGAACPSRAPIRHLRAYRPLKAR